MKTAITIFFLSLTLSQAQFNGYPLATNYPNADINYLATNIHPVTQLYSAIVERVSIVDNGSATITPLSLVNTYVCSAGTNTAVVTNGGWVTTNVYLYTTNVTVTNQFTPFAYTYSDLSGAHTATGMPFLTRGMISDMDNKVDELIPYFMARSFSSNGAFGHYFTTNRNDKYLASPNFVLPMESKAGLFSRAGIGFATNLTTNKWGFINGGSAYYTKQPATTNLYLLAEGSYTSNGWATRDKYTLDLFYYKTHAPIIRYYQGGTNPLTSINIYVAGSYLKQDDQTTVATSKTYTVTASNTPLDLVWYAVTNISSASASFNTNDVYAVVYTNRQLTYGSAVDRYTLSANDFDERYRVLTNLCWTKYSAESYDHPGVNNVSTGRVYNGTYPDEWRFYGTNWAHALSQASNALADASNWSVVTNAVIQQSDYGARSAVEAFVENLGSNTHGIYISGVAYAGEELLDVYEGYGGAPTNSHALTVYRWGKGFSGLTNSAIAYYYDFVSPSTPFVYELDVSSIPNLTGANYQLPLSFYGNPLTGIPEPTTNSAVQRYQILKDSLMIFKWESGLIYK